VSTQREHGAAAPAADPAPAIEPTGQAGQEPGPPGDGRVFEPGPGLPRWRRWLVGVAVPVGFVVAGVVVTWPRATYLAGRLPASGDQAEYVWNMWWAAHQLTHLGNPWFTSYLAAPVGIRLGYDTLTPLLGWVMAPVTLILGPSVAYNLLVIVTPGLAGYATYRLARLWLPGRVGPLAAGAFYGLSGMFAYQVWMHLHTAVGGVFLPLAMEAAIRLRRDPAIWRGVALGGVVGAAMLIDQEFAGLAVILAALLLVPWLLRHRGAAQLRAVAVSAVTALIVASGQLVAMAQEAADAGRVTPRARDYLTFVARLPGLFAPSPRLGFDVTAGLGSVYHYRSPGDSLATFGVVLSALALLGLAVAWRRHSARLLGLLWLGSALLALGPVLVAGGHEYVPLAARWHGLRVSLLMPFTWLIRVPGMSSFREADRLAFLGLVGAALLAGAAVEWLGRHARPALVAVAILGVVEAGWPGLPGQPTMPTALPAVDRPIAADHSRSIVVDVPFGLFGVPGQYGNEPAALALVLATADGHPRAVSYGPLTAPTTVDRIRGHAFYAGLVAVRFGERATPAQITAARRDLRTLHVGWVLVWLPRWMRVVRNGSLREYNYGAIFGYLSQTGFHLDHRADGVVVYRA
jgi:hypothetical protein